MNQRILYRLLWKDAKTLRTLAIATPALIVGFYFLLGLFSSMVDLHYTHMNLAYAIWFMLPMLIAFGAPAVLVGGEEESGSLAWLKTLPAGWRAIATSKLVVTAGCLLLAWGVATACFMTYWALLSDYEVNQLRRFNSVPEPFWLHFAGATSLSVALMLASFITAYVFRSPITALIATIPLLLGAVWAVFYVVFTSASQILPAGSMQGPSRLVAENLFGVFAAVVSVMLLLLLLVIYLAAWRRLTWPESRLVDRIGSRATTGAYRPPQNTIAVAAIPKNRPRKVRALLWQQIVPIRWYFVTFTLTGIFGSLLTLARHVTLISLGCIISALSLMILASFTFYSDSVRKRCLFLYDRGISPTLVWITRVGPTLAASVLILGVAALALIFRDWWQSGGTSSAQFDNRAVLILTIGLASFAMMQLVSQWSPRPTLAFFAGPVFVHLAAMFLAALLIFYTRSSVILLVSAVILLFASWKLMPKWMAGETGRGYIAPFVGAIALAVVLPYVIVLTTRAVTSPEARTAWRLQMLSMQIPVMDDESDVAVITNPAFVRRFDTLATGRVFSREGRIVRLANELAETKSIGDHISFKELLVIINPVPHYELAMHQDQTERNRSVYLTPQVYPSTEYYDLDRKQQFDAVRVLLKWSRLTREQAIGGKATYHTVQGVAEHADLVAAKTIDAYVETYTMTPELKELVSLVPDKDLVRQSRKLSLIRSWQRHQSESFRSRVAGQYVHAPSNWWLSIERKRSNRYVDELCKFILDQWESRQDFQSPESIAEVRRLEGEAYLVEDWIAFSPYYGDLELSDELTMMAEADRLMNELRRRVATAAE